VNSSKHLTFYIVALSLSALTIYGFVQGSVALETGRAVITQSSDHSVWQEFLDSLNHNLTYPWAILLAQIIVIIVAARAMGWLSVKMGQPAVIGEILSGILLGPSLVGYYFPEFSLMLFPPESLSNIQFLSQIGLILFMFVVGMELDVNVFRNKARDALVISHIGIAVPFTLAMIFAYFSYQMYAPQGVPYLSYGLFLGVGMSIAAFPVLARITQERNLHKTHFGSVIITCAAIDDITAWSLLAAVIAIVKAGSFLSALYTIAAALIYVLIMFTIIRPFLKRIGELHSSQENLSKPYVAIFILMMLASAYITEVIGIHALFGAFMAGTIMPENPRFRSIFIEKIEDVAIIIFLPLFFVYTGLRTQIGLLNEVDLWLVTLVIIATGVTGKFWGTALTSRFLGHSWRESLMIGSLMNTRGLMELVVLNIGYDLGVIGPEIFAMMVILALVTTFMTGPLLNLIDRFMPAQVIAEPTLDHFNVLLAVGHPERGRSLLRLAHHLTRHAGEATSITALHVSPSSELNQHNISLYEQETFTPLLHEAKSLKQEVKTLFLPSSDIDSDIVETANSGKYDLLVMGFGQSIFEGSFLGRVLGFTKNVLGSVRGDFSFDERTRSLVNQSTIPVGILVDKGLTKIRSIALIEDAEADDEALLEPYLTMFTQAGTSVVRASLAEPKVKVDLLLMSLGQWKKLSEQQHPWLHTTASCLLIHDPS